MRLRSLGNGHSLCFVAPPEVHRDICDTLHKSGSYQVTSSDVLSWAMEQTCQALTLARPLRTMQGLQFHRQRRVLSEFLPVASTPAGITSNQQRMQQFWQRIKEDDAQTLESLYDINDERINTIRRLIYRESNDPIMKHLIEEYKTMSYSMMNDSSMDNEQERELEHEIEQEKQVQRPPQAEPLIPTISEGLVNYISSGTQLELSWTKSEYAFKIFQRTTAANALEEQLIDPDFFDIYATQDFVKSVKLTQGVGADDFLRPVTWVLSSPQTTSLLIISSHEANSLLPQIKASKNVRLHTYAPRISKKMAHFNHMDFYTLNAKPDDQPPSAESIRDLELFAGSLYYDTQAEYESICHFLGIVTASTRPPNRPIHSDGFLDTEIREEVRWPENCPFDRSPLPFIKQLVMLRIHGQAFEHSHMGALFSGRALREDAFEDVEEEQGACC